MVKVTVLSQRLGRREMVLPGVPRVGDQIRLYDGGPMLETVTQVVWDQEQSSVACYTSFTSNGGKL